MNQSAVCRLALTSAVVLTACAVVVTVASDPLTAQAPPRQAAAQRAPAKADKQVQPAPAEQTIAILVNDEPITAYEIQQRTAFLAMQSHSARSIGNSARRKLICSSSSTAAMRRWPCCATARTS